jgi:hypothetical protein
MYLNVFQDDEAVDLREILVENKVAKKSKKREHKLRRALSTVKRVRIVFCLDCLAAVILNLF